MPRPSKRNDIVQVAATLIAERGLGAVSIRDIAKAAGVRPTSVYRLFSDKEEIFREVLHMVMDDADTWRRDFLTSSATPEEKVKSTVYYAIKDSDDRLKLHRKILQRALVDEDIPTLQLIREFQGRQIALVVDLFSQVKSDKDPYFLFYSVIGLALSYNLYKPLHGLIHGPAPASMDPQMLTEAVLGMTIPSVDWPGVRLLGLDSPSRPDAPLFPASAKATSLALAVAGLRRPTD